MSNIKKERETLARELDDYREQVHLDRENLRLQGELGEVRQELRLAEEVFAGSVEGTIITDAEFQMLSSPSEYRGDTMVGACRP